MTSLPAQVGAAPNQFALLRQRRFAPFFWTQFAGAANDNLFKFALTVLLTYQLELTWLPSEWAGLVIGALFILPFVLGSATAGQLSDQWPAQRMFRLVKTVEVFIMALAAWAWWQPQSPAAVPVLLLCVVLMGLHSTLFGPVKFAYLPQVLAARELTGGNGMVEMGTFVAILLGNMAGGLLVAWPGIGREAVALTCLLLAVLGRVAAQYIPNTPASDPQLRIHWNPFTETWRNLQRVRQQPVVFRSLLGISWMWFFGAVFLGQFPYFAKVVLHGDAQVASLLLAVFSVGVGAGALLCERASRQQVEIGLVPLGALGMSVFAWDLYAATRALPRVPVMDVAMFVAQPGHWRVLADLALLALSAGIYSVPMYALIQLRSPVTHRARTIAANNILNAVFMIVASLWAGALLALGCSVPQVFAWTAGLNAVVCLSVFVWVPDYVLHSAAWVYRLCTRHAAALPQGLQGPALVGVPVQGWHAVLTLAGWRSSGMHWCVPQGWWQAKAWGRWLCWAQQPDWTLLEPDRLTAPATWQAAVQALQSGAVVWMLQPPGCAPGDVGQAALLVQLRQRGVDVPVWQLDPWPSNSPTQWSGERRGSTGSGRGNPGEWML